MAVRVLLVDDNASVRQAYRALLRDIEDFQVVGEAEDGDQVLATVSEVRPDLVLMDVEMKRVGGLMATRLVSAASPGHPKILMSSLHGDDHLIAQAFREGARGYMAKAMAARELVPAMRQVMKGELYISPQPGMDKR